MKPLSRKMILPALCGGAMLCAAPPPRFLDAEALTAAAAGPEKTGSGGAPGWRFAPKVPGQRLAAKVNGIPADCGGVRVRLHLAIPAGTALPTGAETVWAIRLDQGKKDSDFSGIAVDSPPVRVPISPGGTRQTVTVESYYPVDPALPLAIQAERRTADPADTCPAPADLLGLEVQFLPPPAPPVIVENSPGYNAWPIIQTLGNRTVCSYSRGKGHFVTEVERDAYLRISRDGGETWGPEVCWYANPKECVGACARGLDETGALLFWVRPWGPETPRRFELYRSADGTRFEKIAEPRLDPLPMQIMDVVDIPGKGLLCLWFAGNYKRDDGSNCWGTLFSADNGRTWVQRTVERGLPGRDWPTESSAAYLGDGKIIALARIEGRGNTTDHALFQLRSEDFGATWSKEKTNITDVLVSTPSLIADRERGLLHCYYFYRGRGLLNRRTVALRTVWDHPTAWPEPETVALGKPDVSDSGNVSAIAAGERHILAYYMGDETDAAVVTAIVPAEAPEIKVSGSGVSRGFRPAPSDGRNREIRKETRK